MSEIKFKGKTKFKALAKYDLLRKRSDNSVISLTEQKVGYRDYIDEMFAGLMWLG